MIKSSMADYEPTEPIQTSPKNKKIWLFVFVLLMAVMDLWLLQKVFEPPAGQLPKINMNILSASSFIVSNTLTQDENKLEKNLNILALGKSGGDYISPDLTDTILVLHLDSKNQMAKIISIPRDLAVKIPGAKNTVKVNGLYQIGLESSERSGLELVKEKVEEVTGLVMDNFILFDLATVEKIIDDIGGVNVLVKNDIYDTYFPAPGGGYETFSLSSGMRFLDGKTALKFVRTRHSPRGDFERIERQQEVLKAIKGKLISLNPFWDFGKLWEIFSSVRAGVRTDLPLGEIKKIWSLAKNIDLDKIETFGLNIESGLIESQKANWGGVTAYILVVKNKPFDYAKIQETINNFINDKFQNPNDK